MVQTTPACMTWEKLVAAFNKDTGHRCWIRRGFQLPRTGSPSVEPYVRWSRSKELSVQDEVPMLWGKPVIPVCLRQQVLRTLHSAHQGVTGMLLVAEQVVFLAGLTEDIRQTRT